LSDKVLRGSNRGGSCLWSSFVCLLAGKSKVRCSPNGYNADSKYNICTCKLVQAVLWGLELYQQCLCSEQGPNDESAFLAAHQFTLQAVH
jgi:hypothetical protein